MLLRVVGILIYIDIVSCVFFDVKLVENERLFLECLKIILKFIKKKV